MRFDRWFLAITVFGGLACDGSESPLPVASGGMGGAATTLHGGGGTSSSKDAGATTGSGGGSTAASMGGSGPVDPCPDLPVPSTLFNRSVVYREWGEDAVGDGTYFKDQAPWRLGFTRYPNDIWIAKFKVEENTYWGRMSMYGDNGPGVAWISDSPTNVDFAIANSLLACEIHGGGTIDFVVAKDDADALTLKTDPNYAGYKNVPQLRGGHCYYAGFENIAQYPTAGIDANFIMNATDQCDPDCWYLAFDFGHWLHTFDGQIANGSIIPGLTVVP